MDVQHIPFLKLLDGDVQYVVPRWQRRYCWDKSDIERLIEDLLTIAEADPASTHYGGTLITYREPTSAGVMSTIHVVDGQQRLTTVSILLACIAAQLGKKGKCGDWTAEIIRDRRLTNPYMSQEKRRKLRLQDGDEEEYRLGLEGNPAGPGAVTQAWRIVRRLVAHHGVPRLLKGLERLQVVSIGLDGKDDPQQIFESLNATGRPLTESEKVKNWLLIGLPDQEQRDLHHNHWLPIERSLGAAHNTGPIDTFLRDLLRWRTGETRGLDQVYEGCRRWAVRQGHASDRPALCRELARLAELYGKLTGTAGKHVDPKVEQELQHLRAMGIDIHRPLTLRLLHDVSTYSCAGATYDGLVKVLIGIGTWITRLWLADRSTAGMNKAIAELAHGPGPSADEDFAEHWLERIRRLRNTRVGVPNDEEVRQGIQSRKAYGGSATRTSFAVLCALMEAEQREESPARDHLTIEHVMPQKLTDDWRVALGIEAEEKHGRYRDRLSNLTLSGDATNSGMGAGSFDAKRNVYRHSSIAMTRRLADEYEWNEEALERRAEDLAHRALMRWPWHDQSASARETQGRSAGLRWRIEGGPWHTESAASQMVQNVAGALLSRDPANAEKLSGEVVSTDLHLASRYPPGFTVGKLMMRAVPGHEDYVLYPYGSKSASAERCRKMGKRCSVRVEMDFEEDSQTRDFRGFWRLLADRAGGVPGQRDTWRGPSQRTIPLNSSDDRIGIHVGDSRLQLYIRAGESSGSPRRAARMRQYSWKIRDCMGDQELEGNPEKDSENGRTVTVQRPWTREEKDEWPEAAAWIREQVERLGTILVDPPSPDPPSFLDRNPRP